MLQFSNYKGLGKDNERRAERNHRSYKEKCRQL